MDQPNGHAFRTGLAAAAASTCFGASVVATRFVVAQTEPLSLTLFRYTIACVCLIPVLYQVSRSSIARNDLLAIATLGVIFFGVFPWTFSAALTYLPASRVAVELATMPLLTLIVSRLRGYDRITTPKLLGQLLAFAGLFIALRPSGATSVAADAWKGDALIAITVLCGAIYNVFSRPYLKRYPALHVSALSMLAGVIFLAVVAGSQGTFSQVPEFTRAGWVALLFLGTFGGAVGFSLWIWALERSTPSRVAVFLTLNPVTAILLGVVLLNEPVTGAFLLGLAGVLGGIVLANWQPARR